MKKYSDYTTGKFYDFKRTEKTSPNTIVAQNYPTNWGHHSYRQGCNYGCGCNRYDNACENYYCMPPIPPTHNQCCCRQTLSINQLLLIYILSNCC